MISTSLIFIFNPQNRVDTTGNFSTFEDRDDGQPMAVPCHVGPVSRIISSGGRNVSEEVV